MLVHSDPRDHQKTGCRGKSEKAVELQQDRWFTGGTRHSGGSPHRRQVPRVLRDRAFERTQAVDVSHATAFQWQVPLPAALCTGNEGEAVCKSTSVDTNWK